MNVHVVSTVILATHWLIIIGLSVRVIMRRPPVGVSLAWLAVIFSVPFAGAFLYLLFGEKRLGRQRMRRIEVASADVSRWQERLAASHARADLTDDPLAESLFLHAERVVGFPPLPGSALELLSDYHAIFDRLVAALDSWRCRPARRQIVENACRLVGPLL
jgi:cardiolipin synthase